MKATELRIGNWVLIPYQNAPIAIPAHETQVQGMTIFGEILTNNTPEHEGLKTNPIHISGIPLTEEWLLKFGFVSPGYYEDNEIYRINEDDIWIMRNENGFYLYEYVETKIKYIHQLQNLYFALTGKELTL